MNTPELFQDANLDRLHPWTASKGRHCYSLLALNYIDAYMIANLMLMIAQGSFQIFIQKFDIKPEEKAQYLDHLDSGLLKVKVSQSIGGIMFIQLLEDFVNIHNEPWLDIQHRLVIFGAVVIAAFTFAAIWRVTHPAAHQ